MARTPKVVYYPASSTPLTADEIKHVFGQYAAGDAVMVAFRQILAERLAAATVDSASDRLTERQSGHAAGRITEITDLQEEIHGLLGLGAQLRRAGVVTKVKT